MAVLSESCVLVQPVSARRSCSRTPRVRGAPRTRLLIMPPTRYRTGTAQTVLLGLVFFCVPGMWNSITSMAGGLGDARTSSMATAATYALYAVASLVAPSICTTLGARATTSRRYSTARQ